MWCWTPRYSPRPLRIQPTAGCLTGHVFKIVLADRDYRGAQTPEGTWLLVSNMRRLPNQLKKLLKRRQVVEPMIGHMKADGLQEKSWLKGATGHALHAILCGAGHNLRMVLGAWLEWAIKAPTSAFPTLRARRAVLARD